MDYYCCSGKCGSNYKCAHPDGTEVDGREWLEANCDWGNKIGQICSKSYDCCSDYCDQDNACAWYDDATYHEVNTTGVDCTWITTEEECERAANVMGVGYRMAWPREMSGTEEPRGCFSRYDPDERYFDDENNVERVGANMLTFNSNDESTAECGEDETCICIGEVAWLK